MFLNNLFSKIRNKVDSLISKRSSNAMNRFLSAKGVKLGERVLFSQPNDVVIDLTRPSLVDIGSDVVITKGFRLLTHGYDWVVLRNLHGDLLGSSGQVSIGNNVYFGFNVTVLKGVSVGDNCIIGAGSILNKSIPSNSVAAGVPAKVICSIEEYYIKRKSEVLSEALDYRDSITRLGRTPNKADFWEEFPLFCGSESEYMAHPAKEQLAHKYDDFVAKNIPVFSSFDEFLKFDIERIQDLKDKGTDK